MKSGVVFAVKTALVGKLAGPPKGVNDQLMTMELPLSYGRKHVTVVSANGPTMTNSEDVKDKFYKQLHSVITTVPRADKLIILGDFNATVGSDNISWDGVIGTNPEDVKDKFYKQLLMQQQWPSTAADLRGT